jgi:hypothetical protein
LYACANNLLVAQEECIAEEVREKALLRLLEECLQEGVVKEETDCEQF